MGARKIRIGYYVNYFVPGGMEKFVLMLVNKLDRRQFLPYLYIHYKSDPEFLNQLKSDVQVVHLNRKNGRHISSRVRMIRQVRADGIHILQVHNWGSYLEGAITKLFYPRLGLIHVQQGMEYELTQKSSKKKNLIRRMLRRSFQWVFDEFVACSEKTREYLKNEWKINGARVIYNSVDLQEFHDYIEAHNLPEAVQGSQEFKICTVGRIVPVKNLFCLFEAVKILKQKIPQVKLYHIGGDVGDSAESRAPLIQQLNQFRKEKGVEENIEYLGIRDDVTELLKNLDVFALTSYSEGLSLSLLEAQTAGLPAVVTNVGGNPEVVQHGVNGFLAPSNDDRAVAEFLYKLYINPEKRKKMSENARRIVRQQFSVDKMVELYEDLYNQLFLRKG